jgi:hypothetical protein
MPEIGAKQSVGTLRDAMAEVKSAAAAVASEIKAQADKMREDISGSGALVVKKMQTEHDEIMSIFGEFLGNERPGDIP